MNDLPGLAYGATRQDCLIFIAEMKERTGGQFDLSRPVSNYADENGVPMFKDRLLAVVSRNVDRCRRIMDATSKTGKSESDTKVTLARHIVVAKFFEFIEDAKERAKEESGEDGFAVEIVSDTPVDIAAAFFEWMIDNPIEESNDDQPRRAIHYTDTEDYQDNLWK